MNISEKDKYNLAMQKMIMDNMGGAETILCEKCNNGTFVEVTVLKRFSPLITQASKPMVIPIPVLSCNSCGTIVEELLPEPLKQQPKPQQSSLLEK